MSESSVSDIHSAKILLVEDDQSLSEWIKDYLVSKNFIVEQCFRGDTAVDHAKKMQADIVILDGMLPGLDGLEVCKQLKPGFAGRIIMLTARDEDIDEVVGLEVGADDYLTKPVRARVLLARIHTQFRQLERVQALKSTDTSSGDEDTITLGTLYIDKSSRICTLADESIDLSTGEFDMLWLLAKKVGRTVTRDELTQMLRGFDYNGFDRSIDLKVSRLRKKLGDDSKHPTKVVTVWGKGYVLAKDVWQ